MISILCPTRGRPLEVKRMVESACTTVSNPKNIEILFRMDDDDRTEHVFDAPCKMSTITGPRHRNMCLYWNELLPHANGDIFMLGNDDIVFRTPMWDVLVEQTFAMIPDKIALVGGNDGMSHGRSIPHPFVHRRWIETIGYFAAPYFESDYGGDTWNEEVATKIGRRIYIPSMLIEHMHFLYGKANRDQNTIDRLKRHTETNPGKLYMELAPKRREDANKLMAIILGCSVPDATGHSA